jgi:hypothetical protein
VGSSLRLRARTTAADSPSGVLECYSGLVLSYEIDGSILTLTATGTTTLEQRRPVFEALRADARVPDGALLLIDGRDVTGGMSEYVVIERLRVLFEGLGVKLGPVCALIVAPGIAEEGRLFQTEALGFGLRVALFDNELSARQWLLRQP